MFPQVALTRVSGNAKTGPIPTSVTARESCPTTCPFYDQGCYAKYGPAAIHWRKVSNHDRGHSWSEFISQIRNLPHGQLWRHNVAGDLPHNDGNIAYHRLKELMTANKGRRGFTYTHHILNEHNIVSLQNANMSGFTVNVSTENVEIADSVMTQWEIPAVAVVSSDEKRRFFKTSSGRKVIVCPATIHENVTCATCGLCAQAKRKFIIAFPAHGVAKKIVSRKVTNK